MKKTNIYIRIIIFLSILILPTICWGIISLCGMKEKLDFDLDEKREKHTIPSDVKFSELPAEIEAYYNDRVPFRSVLIKANNRLNTNLEKSYTENIEPVFLAWMDKHNKDDNNTQDNKPSYIGDGTTGSETETKDAHEHNFELIEQEASDYENYGYEIYKCSLCGEEKKYTLEKLVDTSLYPMKTVGDTTIIGRYNWLFYTETLADYQGGNIIEDYAGHVQSLINLKNLCDELGKELYFIILPNKNSVYPEYMPTLSRVADKRRVEYLKEYIDANTDVILQYPLKEMYANKPYHQLYFRYDTHWSPYGFQIGVNSLYSAMGMDTIDYEDYEITPVEKYTGDLAILAGMDISSYPSDEEGVISYKPEIACEETEDKRYLETNSESDNKKNIVMMGDSFRFGFSFFLSKDFSHMLMFDRVLKGNESVENQIKEADVIVIELVERNEFLLHEDAKYIYNVLSQ